MREEFELRSALYSQMEIESDIAFIHHELRVIIFDIYEAKHKNFRLLAFAFSQKSCLWANKYFSHEIWNETSSTLILSRHDTRAMGHDLRKRSLTALGDKEPAILATLRGSTSYDNGSVDK